MRWAGHVARTGEEERCICYCGSPKFGKTWVLPVNPGTYHREVLKVRKMLGNASISGFYQTMSVNSRIRRHVLLKFRQSGFHTTGLSLFGPLQRAYMETITPVLRHARTPCQWL